MQALVYDGSFAGWLTAIFCVYEYKLSNVTIMPASQRQDNLFGDSMLVHTDNTKAQRVWKGLGSRTSPRTLTGVYRTFLSEQRGMEDMLLQYVRYAFTSGNIEKDYAHPAVLYVTDMAQKVHREKHRMEAFVRFRQTKDNLYYATVEPDFNVLPLIIDHFEKRYADQQWMIYDVRRKYGIYYDLLQVSTVEVDFNEGAAGTQNSSGIFDEKEEAYQRLWQNYFSSVNIASRKNPKLHIRHMPLRYWKYLTEKQG